MKSMMIAAVAGFTGLATASPFLTQVGERQTNMVAPQGNVLEYSFDLVDVESVDGLGAATNTVLTPNLGANAHIVGVSWDVTIQTVGASWLSEAVVAFTNTTDTTTGLFLTPGVNDGAPGTATYSSGGFLSLIDNDLDFFLSADGILRTEFFESFDDGPGVDAIWNGNITIQYIPTPGALAVLGLGGLVAGRRRR